MCKNRIVVRIEISTLSDSEGKFIHRKMERLAMILANLNNSGKQIIVVSSGAIALGGDKLGISQQIQTFEEMQATAAVGQAELIRFYQYYFNQYNQIVAQVLLTGDMMGNTVRVKNAQNTFDTLLDMNIIPVVNENDAVSLTDIELDDNYTLALQVAKITCADMILIKKDEQSSYIIQPRDRHPAKLVDDETKLFEGLEKICSDLAGEGSNKSEFPESISEIEVI